VTVELLKNANVASGMILPGCQDTGTAIVMGKKGQYVFTDGTTEWTASFRSVSFAFFLIF
jgi:fumarate hydratase class I